MATYPARGPRPTFPTGGGSSGERSPFVEQLAAVVKSLSTFGLRIRICARGGRRECGYRFPGLTKHAEACLPCAAKHHHQLALPLGDRQSSSLSAVSTIAASHAPLSAGHRTPARAREVRDQRAPRLARLHVQPQRRRRRSAAPAPCPVRK